VLGEGGGADKRDEDSLQLPVKTKAKAKRDMAGSSVDKIIVVIWGQDHEGTQQLNDQTLSDMSMSSLC
jgi:hypothetical protein